METRFETHHDQLKAPKSWQDQVTSFTATAVLVLLALGVVVFAL